MTRRGQRDPRIAEQEVKEETLSHSLPASPTKGSRTMPVPGASIHLGVQTATSPEKWGAETQGDLASRVP